MSRKKLALKLLLQVREAELAYWARQDGDYSEACEAGLVLDRQIKDAYEQAGDILAMLAKLETAP